MGIRVYELAKKLQVSSKELVAKLKELKVEVKGHMSILDKETADIVEIELKGRPKAAAPPVEQPKEKVVPVLNVKIPLSVKEFAIKLQVSPNEIIKNLMRSKIMVTINQPLPEEVIKKIGSDFGYRIERLPTEEELLVQEFEKQDASKLIHRAPVVTFMGHVDHGKTSLLDAIRQSKVTESEAGGITQHIGAYEVFLEKGKVAFLDTPGHAAFTAMRARGAHATDIVVLVVAADDGVMPQTKEAIDHARAANVPIVVAINKIDKPDANPTRIKQQMSELNLMAEEWGGKTIVVEVSAKTGAGIPRLLEMLLLEAEMLELKADPSRQATGVVVESKITKGGGPTATVLVQNGTLRLGDSIIIGPYFGKVRSMNNDTGERVKEAGPSTPVEISGLSGLPKAGDTFYAMSDERKARELAQKRQEKLKETGTEGVRRITLEDIYKEIKEGKLKELDLVVKSDVQGSIEALLQSLDKMETKEVRVRIIHSGVGNVNESDVMLAAASNAIVIGFHVDAEPGARELAKEEKIDMRFYQVIYEVMGDIRAAMEGLLEPEKKEVFLGRAEVRKVFELSRSGLVAGCGVVKGKLVRGAAARIWREKKIIFEGTISSLKSVKEDVKEMAEGFECGVRMQGLEDVKAGDVIEAYQVELVAGKLTKAVK